MKRKLRMGMVGGGKDAFIGAIHRIAANMDGLIELSCGALSINPEIAIDSGKMPACGEADGLPHHCNSKLRALWPGHRSAGQWLSRNDRKAHNLHAGRS